MPSELQCKYYKFSLEHISTTAPTKTSTSASFPHIHTTTNTMSDTPLLTLPNELLLTVAENLQPGDLNSYLRTNRRLYGVLNHTLYNMYSGEAALEVICNDDAATLERFLEYGLDIETICPKYFFMDEPLPLLGTAVVLGKKNTVRMLLMRGADDYIYPLLNMAMESKCLLPFQALEMFRLLRELGVSPPHLSAAGEMVRLLRKWVRVHMYGGTWSDIYSTGERLLAYPPQITVP
jgi:hypothetical protein